MGSGETILIIDDDTISLDILAKKLEKHGYVPLTLTSGREVLSVVQEKQVKLVILDIIMPDISGIEVLKTLRAKYESAELPIIMASIRDDAEDIVEALHEGANDYLVKPVDIEIALARIRTHLEVARLTREVNKHTKKQVDGVLEFSRDRKSTEKRRSAK